MNDEETNVETEAHLQWALRQLGMMEAGLESLHAELREKNPSLLALSAPAYEKRIALLQREIAAYLYRNPPAVSGIARKQFRNRTKHCRARCGRKISRRLKGVCPMLEFAEPRIIRPATETDIELLKKALPKGDGAIHTERYEAQKTGDAVYLLAVQGAVPVGFAFVNFKGASDDAVAPNLSEPTADIEDLFVDEKHRNRLVGSRLLGMAEMLVAEKEIRQIGIACAADNTAARALYDERGYLDSGIAPFTRTGTVKKEGDETETWTKDECAYLVKPLVPVAAATESIMEETNTTEENGGTASADNGYPDAPLKQEPAGRPVGEQVVDFAFGVALTAVEVLENTARKVQAEAPGVWTSLQEKGRPAREKLVQSLRDEAREEAEAAARKAEELSSGDIEIVDESGDDADTPGDGSAPMTIATPTEPAPIKPAPRPFGWGRTGNVSAEDEIRALEDRVKTLEREVVVSPPASTDAPTLAADTVSMGAQTPAEGGTSLVDFTPETTTGAALTDSPYAITDDEERATAPTQTGTFVSDADIDVEGASGTEAVSEFVDGAAAPATDANIPGENITTEVQLAPAKGKRKKKTTSEASAGTDTDEYDDLPEVGEEPEA